MTARTLPDHWTSDATWLVQAVDPRARLSRIVRMDEASYRDASFLDDRMMQPGTESRLVSLDSLLADCDQLPPASGGWIFHIGHVGSTLISRLLGEHPQALAIREPRALRDLGFFGTEERDLAASRIGRAMMRPLGDRSVPIVKATSFVSEMADLLVGDGEACLLLTATPENYVATILAGPNSRKELDALRAQRQARLAGRGIHLEGWPTDAAHLAVMAWACEATSLERVAAHFGEAAMVQDFDRVLENMADSLTRIAGHYGLTLSVEEADALAGGSLMTRYSKAPEFDYSPSLRRELLDEATSANLPAIKAALGRLDQASHESPLLAMALTRSREG